MKAFITAFAVFGLALQCAATAAAGDGPRDVSELVRPIREKHGLPGMAGAIVTGAGLTAVGADGVRERGKPDKVTIDDKWHLGSCTKSMTGTLLAMLVEDGKLRWDTKVGEVFKDVKPMDAGWRDVTLEQLATNHAGAPGNLDADGLWGRLWDHTGTPVEQRRALVEGVLKRPPEAKPGTKFIYSNAGFSIAGAMAEKVMKEPWEALIWKRLFEPLGMKSAGFGAPAKKSSKEAPLGHTPAGVPVQPGKGDDNPFAIGPAGIVHASIGDWARYVRMHLVGEKKAEAQCLKPESFVKLHTPVAAESGYAVGWGVGTRPWARGRTLSHSGSNNMWYCVTWIAPEAGFAVLVTCNQGGDAAAKAADEAAFALIQDHLSQTKTGGK